MLSSPYRDEQEGLYAELQVARTAIERLDLTTLAYRQSKHTLNLVNKCINGQCPQFFRNYFNFNKHLKSRDTRQKI